MFSILPDDLCNIIFSFYNPYQRNYSMVLSELKNKQFYARCLNEIKKYCVYDKYKNVISFQKEWLIG
jgi:hypothetical protein